MSVVSSQIRCEKEYKSILENAITQLRSDRPRPMSLTGLSEGAAEAFCDELLENYLVAFGGSRNAMFRLKENWGFLIGYFENNEKLWKRLRKTTDLAEYRSITKEIFHTLKRK